MQGWFTNRQSSYIFLTLGSIIGTLSIIIAVYALTKGCKATTLLSAIHSVPQIQALGKDHFKSNNSDIVSLIQQSVLNLVVACSFIMIMYMFYKIVKLICEHCLKSPIKPDNNYPGYISKVYLEIFDNIDYARIHLCSFENHASNLKLARHDTTVIVNYTLGYFMDSIIANYNGNMIMCKSSNSSFGLPTYAAISLFDRYAVRRMFRRNEGLDNCKLRLIAISDKTVYDLLRNVTKTTYCFNVECQTDEEPIYAVME